MNSYNEPFDISPPVDGQNGANIFPKVTFMGGVSLNTFEAVGAIEDALTLVNKNLAVFAASSTFETDMEAVFGKSADIEALLGSDGLSGITVVPEEKMNGANGGYDPLTGEVYLADAVIATTVIASEAKQSLADVLTEELGHYIDSQVNEFDTPGDEGEYFAALVSGDELGEKEIERLRGEDDTVTILNEWDEEVVVEANSELSFKTQTFPTGHKPWGIAAADFDKDGFEDIVAANYGSNSVSVFFGDGKGGALTSVLLSVTGRPAYVTVADFNRDRNPDIAATNFDNSTVAVFLGDGRGAFSTPSEFSVGGNPLELVAADVNRDRKLDIVTANTSSDDVSVLLGNGDGSFASATNYRVEGVYPGFVAVEDFSGDRKLDIVVTNYYSDNVSVLLGNGDGSFGFPTNFAVGGDEPSGIAAKDLNGDKKLDVVVVGEKSDDVSVMLGIGDGRFGFPNNFPVGDNPEPVAIEDLNGDRKLDIVTANYFSDNVSVLSGNGKGGFEPAVNFEVKDGPSGVVVEDFNGDGKLDLAITGYDSDTISILTNTSQIATTNPNITISDTTITEGNKGRKNAKFAVTLDEASDQTVRVNYATGNGSAKAGKDYRKTNGTLTFKPGQTRKTINVPILGDTLNEGNEKFNLNLSKPNNAKLGDKRGIATIRDNDKTLPKLSIGDAQITESDQGKKQLKFDVTLNTKVKERVEVNYATADGTAKKGSDYQQTQGKLTFKPNQKKKTVTVPILGDTLNEDDEKFTVRLSKPKNAKLGDKRGTGTIKDNDAGGDKPGDSFDTAVNLGKIAEEEVVVDRIGFTEEGDRDTNDFYRFQVNREGTLVLVLDDLLKDANLDLYGSGEELISQSKNEGTLADEIIMRLDPGTYYARVYPQGSDRTSYRLSVDLV